VFEAGDVMLFELRLFSLLRINRHGGIDLALVIHAEEHGAVKAVMRAQNLRHHGHRLLAAVFLVRADEHDVLAFARAVAAGVGEPMRAVRHGMREELECKR
jgi:hypothetical protein